MTAQLEIWLHGEMTQDKLTEIQAMLDLTSFARLSDWQDRSFGSRYLNDESDHFVRVSLGRRGIDEPEWAIDLTFQAERAPEHVVDHYRDRTLAAAEQTGFTVTRVSLRPSRQRLLTTPALPDGTALPDRTPAGWFIDWHDCQRPLHPLLIVWLRGQLDKRRLELATDALGFDDPNESTLERVFQQGRLHDPHDLEFGYRYLPELDRTALTAKSVLITLWRIDENEWAVTVGYRDQRPPPEMIQQCLGATTLAAEQTELQITKKWIAPTA